MASKMIASATVAMVVGGTAGLARGQQRPNPTSTPAPTAAAAAGGGSTAVPADTWQLRQDNSGSLYEPTQAAGAGGGGGAGVGSGGEAARPDWDVLSQPAPHPRVFKKHDLLNVVVRENSKSTTGGSSDQERQVDFDAKVAAFVRFNVASLSLYPNSGSNSPEVNLTGQRDFKGTGEYDRQDTMTTRLEAEVIDVKPNETMVLRARGHMRIDDEEIDVTLTGICRVRDVDADNSVLSTALYDLDLVKKTTGQVHDSTKRGLLHQILDILNPF